VIEPAVLTILLPAAGGCLAFILGGRSTPWLGIVVSSGALATAGWQAVVVWREGAQTYTLGGWGAPLGIDLYVDGLSSVMLLMTAVIMLAVGFYALGYFRSPPGGEWRERQAFTPLWLFLFAALNSLFSSSDVFNLYVALELLTLAGVSLVIIVGGRDALTAAMRYLLAAFAGSLLYLMGVALLYAEFGLLDLRLLSEVAADTDPALVALSLMTVGLMIKTALFPFHAWLPRAHAAAPAPVSAMLSGLVVKASFYLIARLWVEAFPESLSVSAAQLIGLLGALGILWGSLQALREASLKLVVAHSTVAQVGYLFLLIPLVTETAPAWQLDAWSGGFYHVLSHAFAKASLFLCAGTILYAFGNDRIESLRGLSARLPMTTFAFGIAGVALIGLPPSGSFLAKWLLLSSALGSDQWWWAVVIAAGTLLSGAYVFRLLRHAFAPAEGEATMNRIPRFMELVSLALALVALTLGLRAAEVLQLLEVAAPFVEAVP
jgi:multicomponent Na+:H+ antiporter subunit D